MCSDDTYKHIVLPEGSCLHRLIERAVRSHRTRFNYLVVYKNTRGIGVMLSIVEWLAPGQTYINGIHHD